MSFSKIFRTDPKKEKNGVEVQIGAGMFITVARNGNPTYQAMLTELWESQQFVLKQKNKAADDCALALTIEVMANTILVGWRGNLDDDGAEIPYSVEAAIVELQTKDFRDLVDAESKKVDLFKLDADLATAKNS